MLEKMRILVGCLLLLGLVSGANAEEERWLGSYRAASIPGYDIKETGLITAEYSGQQREGAYDEVRGRMKQLCGKHQGVALVNVTLTPAIGEVRTSMTPGQVKVVSPGLHIIGLADCVMKVDKISR